MSNTSSAGLFFLQMLFSIAILFTLLRFLFQLLRVDYYNPISQMVTRFTDPLLQPLRSLIPSNRTIDGASLVVLFLLQYLHLFIITQLRDLDANPLGLAILASAELLSLATSLLFWSAHRTRYWRRHDMFRAGVRGARCRFERRWFVSSCIPVGGATT